MGMFLGVMVTMEVRLACALLLGSHWALWRLGWPVGVFLELTLVKLIEVGSSTCCGWLTFPRQKSEMHGVRKASCASSMHTFMALCS